MYTGHISAILFILPQLTFTLTNFDMTKNYMRTALLHHSYSCLTLSNNNKQIVFNIFPE